VWKIHLKIEHSSLRQLNTGTDTTTIIESTFIKLLAEEETYTSRGSWFTLQYIDGFMLAVYKYTPMSGSSYISSPLYLENKRATVNPKNVDQQCFKWAILAKHVTSGLKYYSGENYRQHEEKYNSRI